MKLPTVFDRYHADIESELKSVVDERDSPLYDMMRYHFGWMDENGRVRESSGGKAVRPTLCLLACEAVGGDYEPVVPAAAAVELVHNYSLIHDDVQDDDRERRHRPTVWSVWGKPQAINAGTAMRMLANVCVNRLDVSCEKRERVQSLIDEATIHVIEGQYLDISYEGRLDITSSDYMKMVGEKTAALIACALEVGAVLGTEDTGLVDGFREFGWNLGLAFQTRDDILGIWGSEDETGKPLGNDIRRCKKTFPIVYAMEKATGDYRRDMNQIYGSPTMSEDAVRTVMRVLEHVGAREEAQRVTECRIARAESILGAMEVAPPFRHDFEQIIKFLAERTF